MDNFLNDINQFTTTPFYPMNESLQLDVADKILDKMFSMTIGKYNKINFSDIEKTRGDITKLKFYKNLRECIDTLKEINNVTHKLEYLSEIELALDNIIKLKPSFEKSFRVENNCGIMLYNLICYAIMESVSYMISSSINFLSTEEIIIPDMNNSGLLNSSLSRFNKCVADGTIYKFITESEKEVMNEGVGETLAKFIGKVGWKNIGKFAIVSAATVAILAAVGAIVREITYFIYKTKHRISEAAEIQATMLELNIKILESKDGTDPKIIVRQQKWVDRFKRISEKFAIDCDKAVRDSNIDIKNDKVDVDSILI